MILEHREETIEAFLTGLTEVIFRAVALSLCYICKSHRYFKIAVWIDPEISRLRGLLREKSQYTLKALILLPKYSYLLQYRVQGSFLPPKSQLYNIICKKGFVYRAFIFYPIDGINTHF